jgi:adenylate cyclase
VQEFTTLELDLIQVKGKTKPVKIFALLGEAALKENSAFKTLSMHHEKMLASYRGQRWEEALNSLEACRRVQLPGIELATLYELYASRIRVYQKTCPASGGTRNDKAFLMAGGSCRAFRIILRGFLAFLV